MSTAKKALTGTFFVAAGSYLSIFIAFVSGVVLARLLDPFDFGIYRISLFFLDLFGRVKEFGLDKALIHKQEDLPQAYRSHFSLQVLLWLGSVLVALAFSPLILKFYSPTVLNFLLIFLFFSLFQTLASTQRVFLEKNLLFKPIVLIDIVALLLSSSLSVWLAFKGFGAVSLVVGYGSNFFLSFLLLWWLRPWPVEVSHLFLFDAEKIKWFLKFGIFLFFGGLTTFVLYKYNDFILGTFLSVTALGFYSRAFNYAQIPTSLITSVISKVALPTYSRLQNEPEKLSGTFSIVLKSIVRISFPLSLILYMVADDFTVFVLGPKWIPMIPIFRILIIYGVFRSIFDDLGELFTAVGQPKIVSFYLSLQAVVSLFLAPLLTRFYKAEGAAISLTTVLALGVFLAYFLVRRVVKVKALALFWPTTVVCFLTMVCFKFVVFYFSLNLPNPLSALLTKAVVFVFFYLIFMSVIDGKSLVRDLKFMLAHLKIKE